jgi:hypothetical protein
MLYYTALSLTNRTVGNADTRERIELTAFLANIIRRNRWRVPPYTDLNCSSALRYAVDRVSFMNHLRRRSSQSLPFLMMFCNNSLSISVSSTCTTHNTFLDYIFEYH